MTAQRERGERERSPARGSKAGTDAMQVTRTAMDQLGMLTGRDADSVSRLERTEDGWLFQVEIVELERIPQSTSVLGSYEVHTDGSGNVTAYGRTRRYYRNQADCR
ncbi:MAG TPA: gas vesicle protein [Mycobacteriales bacterium]|nr:gas vesicle protein [Mycobacteriales bacterium]